MAVHRFGEDGALIDTDSGAASHVAVELQRLLGDQLRDVVPTSHHVLVTFTRAPDLNELREAVSGIGPGSNERAEDYEFVIPVRYDGVDLAEVAHQIGVTETEVIAMHTGHSYVVEFFGFAPGFAYLRGLPEALHLPRLATPRVRVPAGTVAIAAGYCAVYPRESPGGWWQLGHTDITLFDVGQHPPSPLRHGMRVRFTSQSPGQL